MLVTVDIIDFSALDMGHDPKRQVFILRPYVSVRNGPQPRFGTNVSKFIGSYLKS